MTPNPSLEPTRSGKAPWPPRAQYHAALVGQGASPPRSAQLKRYGSMYLTNVTGEAEIGPA